MKHVVKVTGAPPPNDLSRVAEVFSQPTAEVATVAAIMRRWRMIAGVMAAATLLTYLLAQLLTPLYAAKTTVMLDPREPKPAASRADQSATSPSEETLRKNEIAILRSRRLAEAVIARLSLDQRPEFNPALRKVVAPQDALNRFKSLLTSLTSMIWGARERNVAVSGSPEQQAREGAVAILLDRLGTTSTDASRVVEIRFLSESPDLAARIADTIADQYALEKVELDIALPQAVARNLEEKIQVLNGKIRESELTIERLREEHGLLPSLIEQLSELNKQLATATGERLGAEGRRADLRSADGSRSNGSAALVLGSPLIQRLEAEAALLTARIGDMSTIYGEQHPKILEARGELEDLRARIDYHVAKITDSYRRAIAVTRAKETALRQEVEALKARVAKANASEVALRALERETEADRNLLTQLVARLNETKAQINLQGPGASVISKATAPRSPSFPPKLAMVAVAFLFSATGGTIFAVLLERRDTSIRSLAQIHRLTSTPVLGAVPIVNGVRAHRRSPHLHVLAEPRSLFVESLRTVWLRINSAKPVPAKAVLITSPVSGEGKSTIAACLARTLSLAGYRILIVDADLRDPSIHKTFGMRKSPGLAELIAGAGDLDEILQVDGASGTYLLAAGESVPSPADVLQSPKLAQLLRALSGDFDAVIIDSPPVLAVHDAISLAQEVDTTIMVARWGATKTATFITALKQMSDLNIRVKGIVLSMVDIKKYRLYGDGDAEIFSRSFRKYYLGKRGTRSSLRGTARRLDR